MGEPAKKLDFTPQVKELKKGEHLFKEGEMSRSMYYLKSGIVRIYKKKGNSSIEIDTIRAGQLLGELAFLDGNPRSASGEALTNCTLVEVTASAFASTLGVLPDWMKLLLKTVVGRLRTASTRLRQLEEASTSFDYSSKDGKRSSHYIYISTTDALKICSSILLVAARNGESSPLGGTTLRIGLLQRYANQIIGIPVAKITDFLDILAQAEVMSLGDEEKGNQIVVTDMNFLEKFIAYLNEENLKEPSKRKEVPIKSFIIMNLITREITDTNAKEDGSVVVNLAEIKKKDKEAAGKERFTMDDFNALVKVGYASQATLKSGEEIYTTVTKEEFILAYRFQKLIKLIEALNEQKTQRRK